MVPSVREREAPAQLGRDAPRGQGRARDVGVDPDVALVRLRTCATTSGWMKRPKCGGNAGSALNGSFSATTRSLGMPSSRSARRMSHERLPSCDARNVRAVCDCTGAMPPP